MKKIKNIQQLQQEKKRIRQYSTELEQDMRNNWQNLKIAVQPANLAKTTVQNMVQHSAVVKENESSILKSTISYGLSLLANKLTTKAEEKMSGFFKRKNKK